MTTADAIHMNCGQRLIKRENRVCLQCQAFSTSSSRHIDYYVSHAGAQFNLLHVDKVSCEKSVSFRITEARGSIKYRQQGLDSKEARDGSYQTYQLARFLNEPADYKSLMVQTEKSCGDARNGEHMAVLEEQIQAFDIALSY